MRTILVGTDLDERSDPAILRGADLAREKGARLVVCHVAPRQGGVNPLFPQEYQRELASSTDWEEGVAQAVTRRVVDLTGSDAFDVVIDDGDASQALCRHAERLSADLIIVMADRPERDRNVTRDLARSPCSVLALGPSAGSAVALLTLESEVDAVPELAGAARSVLVRPPTRLIVVMWADHPQNEKASLLARLSAHGERVGVPLETWFADVSESSLLARVASDPDIGLVALSTPPPDRIVARTASPLDDALTVAKSSLLLIRS